MVSTQVVANFEAATTTADQTRPLVILDIETTGLSPYRHAVTEIAAVKVQDGKIIEEFHSMINPHQKIPRFITRLTGITNDMVDDAPDIKDVLPGLHEFMEDTIFVGHNVGFDHKFLDHYSRMHLDKPFSQQLLCTCKLARRLCPEAPSKKLTSLCEQFGLENKQAHRAMSDVLATTQLLEHLQKENNNLNVAQLLHIQSLVRKNVPDFLETINN